MTKALFIVIKSMGSWWVDFEGRSQGPHETREAAAMEARSQAQFMSHMNRPAEVLVPDEEGRFWVVWSSNESGTGVPRRVGSAKAA